MNEPDDIFTLALRVIIFAVVVGIFYFTLKSKKRDD